ncbi:MAG TPA: cell division ATP-binding protein FtsE [bacterium]|nr:cell division ATP-binding protein FtsE [bacterium]
MIELYHVTKRYSGDSPAITDVNLKIDKGEFVFITGASGAGKTTLLKLLFAAERPTAGQIIIDGKNVSRIRERDVPALRSKIGVVFQDFKLITHWTVFQNVAFVLELMGLPGREIKRRVWWALKTVRLHHKLDAYPLKLSGGEQQRVAIARALITNPIILLADEPTGNLDPEITLEIMRLFSDINARGATVVIATHDRVLLEYMNKRVVILSQGRVISDEHDESSLIRAGRLARAGVGGPL